MFFSFSSILRGVDSSTDDLIGIGMGCTILYALFAHMGSLAYWLYRKLYSPLNTLKATSNSLIQSSIKGKYFQRKWYRIVCFVHKSIKFIRINEKRIAQFSISSLFWKHVYRNNVLLIRIEIFDLIFYVIWYFHTITLWFLWLFRHISFNSLNFWYLFSGQMCLPWV